MKNLVKILTKSMLLLGIFALLWVSFSEVFRVDKNTSGDLFRNLPKESVDVLALGSSHVQYSINPAVFYAETGTYAYVLGSQCQPVDMSYYFLKEALKTQSPEVVLLDVFTLLPGQSVCASDGMYYVATQQLSGLNQIEAANAIPNEEVKYDYMFDLLMNHSNWKTMPLPPQIKSEKGVNPTLGYVFQMPTDCSFLHLAQHEIENEVTLSDSQIDSLQQIVQLCQEKGIHLILFKSPYDIEQADYDTLQAVWNLADELGVEHVDLLELAEEIGFTLGMDGETWHNNAWGAEKVSRYLATYIQEKNYVQNHQDNSLMDGYLENLEAKTAEALLDPRQIDIYNLLNFAQTYPCVKLIRYQGSDYSSIGEGENALLNQNGFQKDFIGDKETDYYAIVVNNQIIQASTTPFETTLEGHTIVFETDRLVIDGQTFGQAAEMDLVFTQEDFSWSNDIPINYANRFFWKNGCDSWTCE